MNINTLAMDICYQPEEIDFIMWKKETKNEDFFLGQKIKIYGKNLFLTGGNEKGYLYLQEFHNIHSISEIHFKPKIPKVVVHFQILKKILDSRGSF